MYKTFKTIIGIKKKTYKTLRSDDTPRLGAIHGWVFKLETNVPRCSRKKILIERGRFDEIVFSIDG